LRRVPGSSCLVAGMTSLKETNDSQIIDGADQLTVNR
jgi:hypothetical protein